MTAHRYSAKLSAGLCVNKFSWRTRDVEGERSRLVRVDAADSLGEGLDHLTSLADAETALRALLAYHERNLPPDAPRIGIDLALLARALAELGRPSEAVEFCERAEPILLAAFERSLDGPDAERSELARRIADLYEAWGRPEDAAGWRE